jgi:hypothetical protein
LADELLQESSPPAHYWVGDSARANTQDGGVAQLVEHLLCKQRVVGSNPVASTILVRRSSSGS